MEAINKQALQTSIRDFLEADKNLDFKPDRSEIKAACKKNDKVRNEQCRGAAVYAPRSLDLAQWLENSGLQVNVQGAERYLSDEKKQVYLQGLLTKIRDAGDNSVRLRQDAVTLITHEVSAFSDREVALDRTVRFHLNRWYPTLRASEVDKNVGAWLQAGKSAGDFREAVALAAKVFPDAEARESLEANVGPSNVGRFLLYLRTQSSQVDAHFAEGWSAKDVRQELFASAAW